MKRAVFRALACLRTAMIEEFDTIVRLESYLHAAAANEVHEEPISQRNELNSGLSSTLLIW